MTIDVFGRLGLCGQGGYQAVHRLATARGESLDIDRVFERDDATGVDGTDRTSRAPGLASPRGDWRLTRRGSGQNLLDWKTCDKVREKPAKKPDLERVRQASLRLAKISEACQVGRPCPERLKGFSRTDPGYVTGNVWSYITSTPGALLCAVHGLPLFHSLVFRR